MNSIKPVSFELVFEAEDCLEQALASYEDSDADYADCLHLAIAAKRQALPFFTFDVKATRQVGASLLMRLATLTINACTHGWQESVARRIRHTILNAR